MPSNYYPLLLLTLLLFFLTINSALVLLQTPQGRLVILQTIDNFTPPFASLEKLLQPIRRALMNLPSGDQLRSYLPAYTSGSSRFSQGACEQDSDCFIGGCSGEVCSNQSPVDEAFSTCEWSEEFPNVQGYTCGCLNHICGWAK